MEFHFLLFSLVVAGNLFPVRGDLEGLHLYLYTKANRNNPVELKTSDPTTITNSPFVAGQPVKFLCHGYTSSYTAQFPADLKNVYLDLASPSNYNIIAVDWRTLAAPPYETAALNTKKVGKEIALLMELLISIGKSQLSQFHFIGHSLGGQVGAFITPNLANGKKIPRVTGLDPGRPGFEATKPASERLDISDADFVDIIRTSPGIGVTTGSPDPPIGSVDFYPNGGVKQPGCINALDGNLCSHSRAYRFYAESVTTTVGFKSYKCQSYTDFQGSCPKVQPILMGEYVPWSATGTYYLDTKAFSPFAKG